MWHTNAYESWCFKVICLCIYLLPLFLPVVSLSWPSECTTHFQLWGLWRIDDLSCCDLNPPSSRLCCQNHTLLYTNFISVVIFWPSQRTNFPQLVFKYPDSIQLVHQTERKLWKYFFENMENAIWTYISIEYWELIEIMVKLITLVYLDSHLSLYH